MSHRLRQDLITLLVSASIIALLAWFGVSQVDAHHKPTHTGGPRPSSVSPTPTSTASSSTPSASLSSPEPSAGVSPSPSIGSPSPTSTLPSGSPSPTMSASATASPPSSSTPSATPPASPVPSPSPTGNTVHVESQGWWSSDGIDIPTTVGHHIHVEALNFPAPGRVVDGVYDLRVKVTLHDQVGKSSWIRYLDGSDVIQVIPLVLGPCHDCSTEFTMPVDFGRYSSGVREVRISVNVPDEQPDKTGAQRMFQSTGWPVCVRTCSGSDRPQGLAFWEARGWYDDRPDGLLHNYQNARANVPQVKACQVIDIDLQPGSGGLATTHAGVYVNPNMHAGNAGRVLLERDGEYHGFVTIPCDLVPGDKVALNAHDGHDGVVNVLRVVP